MKHLLRLGKDIVNSALSPLNLELSRKHSLGQAVPSDLSNKEIFRDIQVTSAQPPMAPDTNELTEHFLAARKNDLHKWFHYFEVYHRFFAHYRNQPELKVLEIGVFRGGSLQMWKQYFGPTSTIVGIDINPECSRFENQDASIFVRVGAQQDHHFLAQVIAEFGPFDIIIDDGSHISEHMIATLNYLYPLGLKESGVYLVEDTHTNYWEIEAGKSPELTFMAYAKGLVDRLHEPYSRFLKLTCFDYDNPEKVKAAPFTYFFNHTKGISFFDSIVVFEKCRNKSIPNHQIR